MLLLYVSSYEAVSQMTLVRGHHEGVGQLNSFCEYLSLRWQGRVSMLKVHGQMGIHSEL